LFVFAKACHLNLQVVSAGGSCRNSYPPDDPVVVMRSMARSVFSRVTLAFVTAAPLLSVTVPLSDVVALCPHPVVVNANRTAPSKARALALRMGKLLLGGNRQLRSQLGW
jgi:hypothetical protein